MKIGFGTVPQRIIVWTIITVALIGGIIVIAGHVEMLRSIPVRVVMLIGFAMVTWLYSVLSDAKKYKNYMAHIGMIQIVLALIGNWYLLSELAKSGWQVNGFGRIAFFTGALAVLASGWKKMFESVPESVKSLM